MMQLCEEITHDYNQRHQSTRESSRKTD